MHIAYAEPGRLLHRFLRADTPHFAESMRRIIIEQEIYLVSRSDLNDPFDMRPILRCDWTAEGIRQHINNIYSNPLLSAVSVNVVRFLQASPTSLKKTTTLKNIRLFKEKYYKYMEDLLNNIGICCFTEGSRNPLFWAHYAGSYRGVCLELRAATDPTNPFRNCMQVQYTDQRPTILASQTGAMTTVYNKPDWGYISQYGLCTKSTDWAVEKEWRFWLPGKAKTYQGLPTNTLATIYLGPMIEISTRKSITDLVRRSGRDIKVFATSLSDTDFKVEIGKRLL